MVEHGARGDPEHPRYVRARTAVLVAVAVGAVVGGALVPVAPWQVAVLSGWSAAAAAFVAQVVTRLWALDGDETAAHASIEDESRAGADLVVLSAAVASLGGIGLALVKASAAHGPGKAAIIAVALLSVTGAWAVVHTVFTLRYARLYFAGGGGISFNEDARPDYHDFAYLALTVGMTFQVSDTNIESKPIRRAVSRHAAISYLLGAVIIAMAINVVAGLLNR